MAKKTRRSKAGRPRVSRSDLSTASIADLQAELERRASELRDLEAQRSELLAELERVDGEIAELGGSPGAVRRGRPPATVRRGPGRPPSTGAAAARPAARRTGGKRPRNKMSLVDALRSVLEGQTMGVSEVAEAVQSAGYRTTSANFRTIVNQALINNPDVFKKVARGQYTAK